MRTREALEAREEKELAPWAHRAARSAGRIHPEPEHAYRTAFQRDRDRIVHSRAFRRLQYKTQVFVFHEGDHFRNRLTHTLEVAQIARTLARALGANEDLTEAIVLAHDLGHGPFGHAGERVLHALLLEHGGFEHNRQSLRIVDWIERRTERYRGLNLTAETRAGILKHGIGDVPHPVPLPPTGPSPSVEAQIADCADEIAYNAHDVDDGLRSGLLAFDALRGLGLVERALARLEGEEPATGRGPRTRLVSALIDLLVTDVLEASAERLAEGRFRAPADVIAEPEPVVRPSEALAAELRELASFLRSELYAHRQVLAVSTKAERILRDLWAAYTRDPRLLPPHVRARTEEEPLERVVADYLAGMTDRYAMEEHVRLFDPRLRV